MERIQRFSYFYFSSGQGSNNSPSTMTPSRDEAVHGSPPPPMTPRQGDDLFTSSLTTPIQDDRDELALLRQTINSAIDMIDEGASVHAVRSYLLTQEHKTTCRPESRRGQVPSLPNPSFLSNPDGMHSTSKTFKPPKIVPMTTSHNPVLGREEATLMLFIELMKKKQVRACENRRIYNVPLLPNVANTALLRRTPRPLAYFVTTRALISNGANISTARPLQVSATPPECNAELAKVTRVDVAKVARGFVSMIMSSLTEEEAVTRCLDKYPLLRALDVVHPEHFEELLVLTAVRVLKGSRKYAALRFFIGAGLSMFNTAVSGDERKARGLKRGAKRQGRAHLEIRRTRVTRFAHPYPFLVAIPFSSLSLSRRYRYRFLVAITHSSLSLSLSRRCRFLVAYTLLTTLDNTTSHATRFARRRLTSTWCTSSSSWARTTTPTPQSAALRRTSLFSCSLSTFSTERRRRGR